MPGTGLHSGRPKAGPGWPGMTELFARIRVLYDRRISGQEEAALALSFKILELCIVAGGSITGEHGVGEEKKSMMAKMFAEPDLATMQRVRCAFDPLQLANPTKVFPTPRLCGEKPGEYVLHPLETAGLAERF